MNNKPCASYLVEGVKNSIEFFKVAKELENGLSNPRLKFFDKLDLTLTAFSDGYNLLTDASNSFDQYYYCSRQTPVALKSKKKHRMGGVSRLALKK